MPGNEKAAELCPFCRKESLFIGHDAACFHRAAYREMKWQTAILESIFMKLLPYDGLESLANQFDQENPEI